MYLRLSLASSHAYLSFQITPFLFLRQVQMMRARSIPGYVPEFTGVYHASRKIMAASGLAGVYQVWGVDCAWK